MTNHKTPVNLDADPRNADWIKKEPTMTDTNAAPLFQVSIRQLDKMGQDAGAVSHPTLAHHAIRGVHKSMGSLRTVPAPEADYADVGVWLALLPAGAEATLSRTGHFVRRVAVSGATYLIEAEMA